MTINKSQRLLNVRYDLRGPISDEADRLEKKGIKIIRLNTGNPAAFGVQAPPSVTNALAEYAAASAPYCPTKGLLKAREAIVHYCAQQGIHDVDADHVFTGNGVS